ncbi:MAG: dTMP kinase [Chlamydiales bacterium]
MPQSNRPYTGFFLTVEGGEGCGKSTLCDSLTQELGKRGYNVVRTREPGGTALSEHLRGIVLSPKKPFPIGERTEMLLFLTARVQHLDELILPALRAGKVVICERFNDSTFAYQACARHLGYADVELLCRLVCNHIEPDCTLLLDIDPAVGLQRIKGRAIDRLEQEELQFHKDVRQGYLHLLDKYSERIHLVDATPDPKTVFGAALALLDNYITVKPCG